MVTFVYNDLFLIFLEILKVGFRSSLSMLLTTLERWLLACAPQDLHTGQELVYFGNEKKVKMNKRASLCEDALEEFNTKKMIRQQEDGNEVGTLCWVEECHVWS
jgi:hypothetical protein